MSVHFILDGYNILKQVAHLTGVKLRNDRLGLLWFLLEKRPQGSPRNRVTVVFDGFDDPENPTRAKPLEVVFSGSRKADDIIVSMVQRSPRPRSIVVVTDDREIRLRVKDTGASVTSVKAFVSRAVAERPRTKRRPEEKPDPGSSSGRAITDELEKEWT